MPWFPLFFQLICFPSVPEWLRPAEDRLRAREKFLPGEPILEILHPAWEQVFQGSFEKCCRDKPTWPTWYGNARQTICTMHFHVKRRTFSLCIEYLVCEGWPGKAILLDAVFSRKNYMLVATPTLEYEVLLRERGKTRQIQILLYVNKQWHNTDVKIHTSNSREMDWAEGRRWIVWSSFGHVYTLSQCL